MPNNEPSQSSLILYQTEDGRTRIQCRFENETIWLTQVQIAELFQTSVPNINLHLTAIYAEGELTGPATIKSYLIVRTEGAREMLHYRLSAILAVGFRVRSYRARNSVPGPLQAVGGTYLDCAAYSAFNDYRMGAALLHI